MRKTYIALPKTMRLLPRFYEVFKKAGYVSAKLETSIAQKTQKQLEYESDCGQAAFLLVNNMDIPQYVDRNWAEIGFTAFDCYREYELYSTKGGHAMRGDNFITNLLPDLGFCKNARFCVAGLPEKKEFYEKCKTSDEKVLTVASFYPAITSNFFARKGILADTIKIMGSSELMPIHGGVDVIFDIVETGSALVENGLIIYEEAMPIKTKILVSKAALKYDEKISVMIEALRNAIES
ncbi:MAG: ATP phosphoribosyltransferase [Clostridiales bacterium]|jgi:ATP phosphoribosyltransferase|nr:ATP phosphoribosyltransferase [Clostridiales bacterium]